jgi:transposase
VSLSYTAPFIEVQRAKVLLLAHHEPACSNTQLAKRVGCCVSTVREWRQRFVREGCVKSQPRRGCTRKFSSWQRTHISALACSAPSAHGNAFKRWSAEKLAAVASEKQIVSSISASSIRRWLREDKIKPWRYHSWQKSTDPQFVEKAGRVLDLYEKAEQLAATKEMVWCVDEKPSIHARERVDETLPAIPGHGVRVADRYIRRGAVQLFCALMVATGKVFADCAVKKCFVDFQHFLVQLFQSAHCAGMKVMHLILDNGPTHAPNQLGSWIASLELSFEVRIYWLPTYASWLDQVEIIFSKVQRDVLTPNDYSSVFVLQQTLLDYFDEINQNPKPVHWTYTKAKMLVKFAPASEQRKEEQQLAA